jgi:hypothetical protein
MKACLQKLATLALVAGALGGCVTFEHAPVSRYDCDPALAGQWQTVKTERLPRPIEVAPDCRMRWPLDDASTYETTLRSFTLDDDRYLAFTPEEADRLMDMGGDLRQRAPAGSVLLARYRIDGDEVKLWLADPKVALAPTQAGTAPARRLEESLAHVEGSRHATAKLLRTQGDALFRTSQAEGMTRLKRVPAEAAP